MGTESPPGRLVGQYTEVIEGLLPFPVILAGPFELDRRAKPVDAVSPTDRWFGMFDPVANPWSAAPTGSKRLSGPFPLAGVVRNAEGRPVLRADVVLSGSNALAAATAGTDGRYMFPAVYPGVYRVSAGSGTGRRVELTPSGELKAIDGDTGEKSPADLLLAPREQRVFTGGLFRAVAGPANTSRWFQPGASSSDARPGAPAQLRLVGGSVGGGGMMFGPRSTADAPAVLEVGSTVPVIVEGKK